MIVEQCRPFEVQITLGNLHTPLAFDVVTTFALMFQNKMAACNCNVNLMALQPKLQS